MSRTPTHLMASITATATSTTKAHSVRRVRTPRLRAREALMLDSRRLLYMTTHRTIPMTSAQRSSPRSEGVTASTSPMSREEYLANPPPRERISSPAAMEVEENTLMMVSVEAEPVCLMRQMRMAHTTPNTSMLTRSLLTPSTMPRPMPVRALWPSASEKKAICWLTAMVPNSPSRGVSSRMASSAFFIKENSSASRGSSASMTA